MVRRAVTESRMGGGAAPFCSRVAFFTHLIGPTSKLSKASGTHAFQSTRFIHPSRPAVLGSGSSGSVHRLIEVEVKVEVEGNVVGHDWLVRTMRSKALGEATGSQEVGWRCD